MGRSPVNGQVFLGVVIVLAVAGYLFSLWRYPLSRCRRCKGTGRVAGSRGKAWGRCPACKDKPPRPRTGAAAVAALAGKKHGKKYW